LENSLGQGVILADVIWGGKYEKGSEKKEKEEEKILKIKAKLKQKR
jgi:hypothetical protein